MPKLSPKLLYTFGVAVVGLATTLAVNDFQFTQAYRLYSATSSQIFGLAQTARVAPAPPTTRTNVGFKAKLHEGWNMLGTAGQSIGMNEIKGCKFDGPALWYNGKEYVETGHLEFGRGYWVYVLANCVAEFSTNSMPRPLPFNSVPTPTSTTSGASSRNDSFQNNGTNFQGQFERDLSPEERQKMELMMREYFEANPGAESRLTDDERRKMEFLKQSATTDKTAVTNSTDALTTN